MGTNYGGFLSLKMGASRNSFPKLKCLVARSPIGDWSIHGRLLANIFGIYIPVFLDAVSSEKFLGSLNNKANYANYEVSKGI